MKESLSGLTLIIAEYESVLIGVDFDYDELSDQGYSSLPKRYQKSDGLQVQLCWVGARRHES